MTPFYALSLSERAVIAGTTFLSSAILLILTLYRFASRSERWKCALNTTIFLLVTAWTCYLSASAYDIEKYPLKIPYFWTLVIALPLILYAFFAILSELKRTKKHLSPSSVKETLDNLQTGICFADGSGRIILINQTMAGLAYDLLGSFPQMIRELNTALNQPDEKYGVTKLDENIFRFENGKIWKFDRTTLQEKSLEKFTQTTAQDVTELYHANEAIRRENDEIHKTIEKTKELTARLADRVREQETLALKIQVHNEIGASLLALSRIIKEESGEEAEERLKDLQRAVWHFSQKEEERLNEIEARSETLGVKIVYDGEIPKENGVQKLFALVLNECVTNCKKHADGTTVYVKIEQNKEEYVVSVTNDGKKPNGPITEGGGLSALRLSVEKQKGSMKVLLEPKFTLRVTVPKEEK